MISNITGSITARVDLQAVQQQAQDIVKKVQQYALPIIATIGVAATAVTAYATGGIASPETLFVIASSAVAYLVAYLTTSKSAVATIEASLEAVVEAVKEEEAPAVEEAIAAVVEAVKEEAPAVEASVEVVVEAASSEVAPEASEK